MDKDELLQKRKDLIPDKDRLVELGKELADPEKLRELGKDLITGKAISLGAKALGAAPLAVGWDLYHAVKDYQRMLDGDEENKSLPSLKAELEKWQTAINIIGRHAYIVDDQRDITDYSAIDILGVREEFYMPNERFAPYDMPPNKVYHLDPRKVASETALMPEPAIARAKLKTSLEYVVSTKNPLNIENFTARKTIIMEGIMTADMMVEEFMKRQAKDYREAQAQMFSVVTDMVDIEYPYVSRIAEINTAQNMKHLKYAGVTIASVVAGAVISKKLKLRKA